MQAGMNQGDNLDEIYAWIDEIPFSRPKKNIPRDFSDGVLMAEVLKMHYPRLVDVHNYIPASSVAAKRENWSTLNRKVFSKIDMRLSKEVVNQLANAQQGVIEKVLMDLRNKICIKDSNSTSDEKSTKVNYDEGSFDKENRDDTSVRDTGIVEKDEKIDQAVKTSSSNISETKSTKNLIGKACGWVVGWMWPFNESPKISEKESSSLSISAGLTPDKNCCSSRQQPGGDEDELPSISCQAFLELRKEVDEKDVAISILNRKVSCLESVMKLKDKKIGNLAAQISATSSAADAQQNLRPHVIGSCISRLRSQTKSKLISRRDVDSNG